MKKFFILISSLIFTFTSVDAISSTIVDNTGKFKLTGGSKYNVSDGNPWVLTFFGIDLDYDATVSQKLNLNFGDDLTGSGWENFPIQIQEDHFGANGHLLQAYDKWFVGGPISSHGFNSGSVTGPFDIRVIIQQNSDDTWSITPQYLIPTGSGSSTEGSIGGLDLWHTFYDGAYNSADAFDMTVIELWAQVEPSSSGQVEIQGGSVVPIPGSACLLAFGLLGLAALRRKFNK